MSFFFGFQAGDHVVTAVMNLLLFKGPVQVAFFFFGHLAGDRVMQRLAGDRGMQRSPFVASS